MNKTKVKLPKWLENRYEVLWKKFEGRPFKADEAELVLSKSVDGLGSGFAMLLSDLKRAGWITVELDPKDSRRRIYRLKSKDDIISDALSLNKETLTRSDIEGILKKAADLIRTRVDYKFILILLFIKRISDKWEADYQQAYKEAKEDGLSDEDAKKEASNPAYHDFDFPQEYLWDEIRKDVSTLPEKLSKALKVIAEKNQDLKDVLDNVDFIQFTSNRENAEVLRQLVELFSERKLHSVSADILGDAYEWVLKFFAPQKAKEGEVYTPREVIKVLVEMLDPQPGESIYDPACGSGGMLIVSYKHVEDNKGKKEADKLFLHGQEANHKTLAFGKMNMYIHDIRNVKLMGGDTLLFPKFKEGSSVKKFDVVIANPPWNQDGYGEEVVKKGEFWKQRFEHGYVPNQSADWAWIQHMLSSSKGCVGVVMDNGCLFRGGKEKAIRSRVIEDDLIEAVILLPEKLFYNTGAPGAILILNKNKAAERKGKILFINASETFEKHPDVRKLNILSDDNIGDINKAYHEFKNETGFSEAFSLEEIKGNDYNLNVSLYVYPEEEREEIDVKKEWQDLKVIKGEIEDINKRIDVYLEEIE